MGKGILVCEVSLGFGGKAGRWEVGGEVRVLGC